MKRILRVLLIICPCLFLFTKNVNALENTYYYSGLNISTMGLYTDNVSATNIGESIGYKINTTSSSGKEFIYAQPTSNLSNRLGIYGVSLTQCDMSFVSGSYYSVTYYFEHAINSYPFWRYSQVTYHLGISDSSATNYLKRNFNPSSTTTDIQTMPAPTGADGSGYVSSFTVIFQAPENGTCLTLAYTSSNFDVPISGYSFLGYQYKSLGSNAPSASDIKNELNSSFNTINSNIDKIENNIMTGINTSINSVNDNINNATNDINNNINNATNSINDNINDMSNKLDNSINSDDEDTSSNKCGIVCKLKGIWNGIVNLPQNIWNFLKVGFDAITSGISDMFQGIKDLFTPDPECYIPENLFDSNIFTSNLADKVSDNEFLLKGSFSKQIKLSDSKKEYTISFDYKTAKLNGLVISTYDGSPIANINNTLLNDYTHYSYTFESNGVKLAFQSLVGNMYIKNIKIVEGTTTEEVCTESGSIFDWFGKFFKNIVSGILELPSKLVNLLIEGLKMLFVPTDDQLYEIVNDSKELTENFGFVGEAVNFFLTIFTSLLGLVNANGCVELPEFSVGATSLFDAHTFWEAQNVCLADNAILSSNITTIRTITSIVLVSLFINFAARKFFNILNKNDNDQARTDAYDIK